MRPKTFQLGSFLVNKLVATGLSVHFASLEVTKLMPEVVSKKLLPYLHAQRPFWLIRWGVWNLAL